MNRAALPLLLLAAALAAACDGRISFQVGYQHDGSEGGGDFALDKGVDAAGADAGDATGASDTVADAQPDAPADASPPDATGADRVADVASDARVDTGADVRVDTGVDLGTTPGRCTAESQCPQGLHCDTTARTCVVCLNDGHCASSAGGPRCDTARQRCVACLAPADCGTGRTCTRGRRCVTTCIKNVSENCPAQASHCEDTLQNGDLCSACNDDTPSGGCAGTTPICYKDEGACVGCLTNGECGGTTRFCDPVTNRCAACLVTTDCPAATPFCNPAVGCVAAP